MTSRLFARQSTAGKAALIALLSVGGLGIVVIGALLGFWIFMHLWIGFTVKNQPITLSMPPTMNASLSVTHPMDVRMNGIIHAQVPFDQDLNIPFNGRYNADVSFAAIVPVRFTISYVGVLPVNTMAEVTLDLSDVHFANLKAIHHLKIKAKLPLKLNIPIHLVVPVNVKMPFLYAGPLGMDIHQSVPTHVSTTLNTELHVDQAMHIPVYGEIHMDIHIPQHPIRAILDKAHLYMRVKTLGFDLAQHPDCKLRADNPWGRGLPDCASKRGAKQSASPQGST